MGQSSCERDTSNVANRVANLPPTKNGGLFLLAVYPAEKEY